MTFCGDGVDTTPPAGMWRCFSRSFSTNTVRYRSSRNAGSKSSVLVSRMRSVIRSIVWKGHLRNVRKIHRLTSDFVRIAQRKSPKPNPHRFNDDWSLAVGEHYAAHADETLGCHRVSNDRERFLSYFLARRDVVRCIVVAWIRADRGRHKGKVPSPDYELAADKSSTGYEPKASIMCSASEVD
jgi:hypothetical protein